MKVKPIITEPYPKDGEVVSVHFDITIIISKQNELYVIDSSEHDYRDYIDSNTLLIKFLKLEAHETNSFNISSSTSTKL